MHRTLSTGPRRERGTAIVFATAVIILLASLTLALSHMDISSWKQTQDIADRTRVEYTAEAGLNEAQAILDEHGKPGLDAVTYPRDLCGISYWCEVTYGDLDLTLDDDLVRVVCIAEDGETRTAVEGVFRRKGLGPVKGALGALQLTLDSNAFIDSWDSRLGTYATQATNCDHGKTYARANANTGSNGGITLNSGAVVFGDALPGPTSAVSTVSGCFVTGSSAPAARNVTLRAVEVPTLSTSGPLVMSGSATQTIAPGDRRYDRFDLGGDSVLTIRGPANVVVGSFLMDSNAALRADTSGGPVTLYVTGSFDMRSNSQALPLDGKPQGLSVRCSTTTAAVTLLSNTKLVGTIYAPFAPYDADSNSRVFGAVVAKRVDLRSGARIHVDEALFAATVRDPGPLERISWRPLSREAARGFVRP